MLDPIVKTVDVPCDKQKAFTVFLDEMETWWPLGRFTISAMKGAPARHIRVESRVGGKITEVGADGDEYLWGEITRYNPYDDFAMDFQIPSPDWEIGPMTLVEVTFTTLDDGHTRVALTQSNWEALGPMAPDIRGGYDFGWNMILQDCFKQACEG